MPRRSIVCLVTTGLIAEYDKDRPVSPVWELRRCGRRFEAEASFVEGALEEHRQMHAVSAVRLTLAYPSSASPPAAAAADWHQRMLVKYANNS